MSRDLLEETLVKPLRRPEPRAISANVVLEPEPALPTAPRRATSHTTMPSMHRRAQAVRPRSPLSLALSRETLRRAFARLRSDYRALSVPKRLLIPITVIFLALGAPSSSRADAAATSRPVVKAAVVVPSLAPSALPAAPPVEQGVLPSARALAAPAQAKLSNDERRAYDQAIAATLAGDWETAETTYARLAAAHPESTELKAALRVLAAKKKKKVAR